MFDDYSFLAAFLVVALFFVTQYFRRDPMVRPSLSCFFHTLNNVTRFQLDAIPTVGFSHPILSYLSALQFCFKSISMLKEGYEKVICLTLYALAPN